MTKRRELFPLIAGVAGISAAPTLSAVAASLSDPELRRVSYKSARTGKQRDYFVYLPRGFVQQKQWPRPAGEARDMDVDAVDGELEVLGF